MNDRWLDAAAFMVEDAVAELADVGERLAALPMHSAPAAALRLPPHRRAAREDRARPLERIAAGRERPAS